MVKRSGERVGLGESGDGYQLDERDRVRERLSLLPEYHEQAPEPASSTDIPLDLIMPDPVQPRYPMPPLHRADLFKGKPIRTILDDWETDVRSYLRVVPSWQNWIEGRVEVPDLDSPRPEVVEWVRNIRLAANIFQVGLHNPIDIYPYQVGGGGSYQIQSGERRFLAFNTLAWLGYRQFDRIPATIRDHYDPILQAVENGVRQDLNAIETARQLALILMRLNDVRIESLQQQDISWYARASALPIPYGHGDQVALMMGLPSYRQVNRYHALLSLPNAVWTWADDFNWPESKIRSLVEKARDKVSRKIDERMLIKLAQAEVTKALGGDAPAHPTPRERAIKKGQIVSKQLRRYASFDQDTIERLTPEIRQDIVAAAKEVIKRFG